jgi:hypothetical protein
MPESMPFLCILCTSLPTHKIIQVILDSFPLLWQNICDNQLQGGKSYFISRLPRIPSMLLGLHCFWALVRQSIMAAACAGGNSSSHLPGKRGGDGVPISPIRVHTQWYKSLPLDPTSSSSTTSQQCHLLKTKPSTHEPFGDIPYPNCNGFPSYFTNTKWLVLALPNASYNFIINF